MRRLLTPAILLSVALNVAAGEPAPVHFEGDAVLRAIDATRLAVFLDSNGDKTVDHGFLLSSDIPIASGVAVSCPAARIDFTDGYARLVVGGRLYDLYVAGYPEPPAAPEDADVTRYTGYALLHSTGDSGCDLTRALEGDASGCYRYGEQ